MFDRVTGRENACAIRIVADPETPTPTTNVSMIDKLRELNPKLYDILCDYVELGIDSIHCPMARLCLADLIQATKGEAPTTLNELSKSLTKIDELTAENDRLKKSKKFDDEIDYYKKAFDTKVWTYVSPLVSSGILKSDATTTLSASDIFPLTTSSDIALLATGSADPNKTVK